MRVFHDDLEVRPSRRQAARKHARPPDKQDYHEGEVAVATVWLAFYLLAIGVVIVSPFVSRAIELAAR